MQVWGRVGAALLAAAASRVVLFCPLQLLCKLLLLPLKIASSKLRET
jgi:hypothetical protein